jgi:23S rRNA pseudouridine2605 synthase
MSQRDLRQALPLRLAKYLHDASGLSSASVQHAWEAGRVSVAVPPGARGCTSLDDLVFDEDVVCLDARPVRPAEHHTVHLLNKPAGTLCVPVDSRGKGDLTPWLTALPQGTFAVGRLDRNTTGALLLTTDGQLSNALLRPERGTVKTYELTLRGRILVGDPRVEGMTKGVDVGPFVARAQSAEVVSHTAVSHTAVSHAVVSHAVVSHTATSDTATTTLVRVTLVGGKHREIRRLCRALGLRLATLHRAAIGSLALGAQPLGALRRLSEPEIDALWEATGGRERLFAARVQSLVERAARCRANGSTDTRLESWLADTGVTDTAVTDTAVTNTAVTDTAVTEDATAGLLPPPRGFFVAPLPVMRRRVPPRTR